MIRKGSMAEAPSRRFTLIPKQRIRRSKHRVTVTLDSTDSSNGTPLGHFEALPLEIFYILLEYLPVKDISVLSMASKAISRYLISYISSPGGNLRLLLQDFYCPQPLDESADNAIVYYYRDLGLLYKRCTLLLSTRDRLNCIQKAVTKIACFKMHNCLSPTHCLGLFCYGAYLKVFTAGWDEAECHKVYAFICDLSNLPRKVRSLVSKKPGTDYELEIQVRLFCRNVLLDHWTHRNDSAFWLSRLLKPWPIVNQAQLLYMIFGPLADNGFLAWQKMAEGSADDNSLKRLADAIKLLYDTQAKEWTTDDVMSLLDELTVVPQGWLLENSARLLILSGSSICYTFMANKAVKGKALELARIIVFLALVCEKDMYCMKWAVKIMQKIADVFGTQRERKSFLFNVSNIFAHVIMNTLQSALSGGHNQEDGVLMNVFHLVNAQANFYKEVLCMTLSSPSV